MALLDLLDRVITVDPRQDTPLHAQLRLGLKSLIEHHFQDGDRFFSEPQLIQKLAVSQVTVRRALADLGREGLLERQPAKGTFVRKSKVARSATKTVGVFTPAWDSFFLSGMLESLAKVCRQNDYRIQIYHTEKGEKVSAAFRWVEQAPANEGIIFLAAAAAESAELYRVLAARDYRIVAIDQPVPGQTVPLVLTDNQKGIALGMEHLLGLGHRRIVLLVGEPEEGKNVVQRMKAYREVMAAAGLEAYVITCGTHSWESSFDAAYRMMPEVMALKPTAVFAVSDCSAWAALKWLAERNISVPREVSVLGFDGDSPSKFTQPALTTVAQPHEALSKAAVELLWADPFVAETQRLLAPSMTIRESTAAPKK
jgi:LacI family transcriptional regulator